MQLASRAWLRLCAFSVLALAALHLAVSTVGRMVKRPSATPPPSAGDVEPEANNAGIVRTVTAKYPGHVWNVDLIDRTVSIGAGFWVPWIPGALAQVWPFCWWVGFILDHFSRRVVGFSVFGKEPTGEQLCDMLDRAVERVGRAPKYTVTDQGPQFSGRYLQWCGRHGVKPRYGAVGENGSLAVMERFFLTLKTEAMQVIMVPFNLAAMRAEFVAFVHWYDAYRPHQSFGGRTPAEVYERLERVDQGPGVSSTSPLASGGQLRLEVSYLGGKKHLPIVELRAAA